MPPSLHRKNFFIILPEASPTNISEGYEVTIRADAKSLDDETVNTLHEIGKRRKLEVAEAPESIIFYSSSDRVKKIRKVLDEWKYF